LALPSERKVEPSSETPATSPLLREYQRLTTHLVLTAEILSYSRNKGLFAGVSLEGSTLRSDGSANEKLYGKRLTAKEIIRQGRVGIPACAHELVFLLDKKSPVNKSDPKSLQ